MDADRPELVEDFEAPERRWWRRRGAKIIIIAAAIGFCLWFVPWVFLLKGSTISVTRYHKTLGRTHAIVGPGTKEWTDIRDISRFVQYAIVVSEDDRFYEHFGLDFHEMASSAKLNLKRGYYARGGSTISQQVVKMAFLSPHKTLIRKAREAVGAVLLELFFSKNEIIEWYVNLVEFGSNVYGIRDAAAFYFHTKPQLLTVEQAVQLAMILPNPGKWSKGLRQKDLTPFGQRRFAHVLRGMRRHAYVSEEQYVRALTTGNFGRPIAGYENLLKPEVPDERGNLPETEEGATIETDPEAAVPEDPGDAPEQP